ncbi:MAG: hypothetical protein CFH26_00556 [Alphaproteobacteria bacterium MarineAlpha6_Bin4]|nr:MAG: hypothetical protein CFH25_00497 [Alphaproteobacteria bacterium MarineAlpha6_Bin3]PPR37757.1 MAG: hypothetical protein CFH26_00556 [Alphaproteobacteria bacterium MarineAlpha6_Bin4]|tara:strand:- start:9179 stop:10228 length:1050 start_codon:yes stop_codon:yes gene_type:complete
MVKTGKTAVISIYPGIGDIVWHLPFFRALASRSLEKKIHLFTRKTTLAKEILKYDKTISKVYYLNETRQFFNTIISFPKIIKKLKKEKFETIWIFHRSPRYAVISRIAGIKNIYGFGLGAQKIWLSSKKGIGDNSKKKDNIFKAKKLLSIHGIKCKNNFKLELPDFVINKKLKKFKMFPKPWIAIGFSCNKTAFMKNNKPYSFYRTWRPEFFSDLINLIHSKNKKIFFFLIGAKNELNLANKIKNKCLLKSKVIVSCNPIITNLSILLKSKVFIGNDSGPLNLSGAMGIKSFGLFGASPPIKNVNNIYPIVPPEGAVNPHKYGFNPISLEEGMDLIKPQNVFKKIKKFI